MRVIVFGAGAYGRKYCQYAENDTKILAIADNNCHNMGGCLCGHSIIPPSDIPRFDYDKIVLAIDDLPYSADDFRGVNIIDELLIQLGKMGIAEDKIELQRLSYIVRDSHRVNFIKGIAQSLNVLGIIGAVAECGVFRGHLAGLINEFFPERKLYLFDSFEGHRDNDVLQEIDLFVRNKIDETQIRKLSGGHKCTNEQIALLRCPFRENVVVKKGYIPETFEGLEDERFVFVNLDMDTYAAQLAGLEFFAQRMSEGGIILLHDYFHPGLEGVKMAVDEFAKKWEFVRFPINDSLSIALRLIKPR